MPWRRFGAPESQRGLNCSFLTAAGANTVMNPITNIKSQNKLNEDELKLGISGDSSKSWHQKYKDSAWIYIGGLPYELTEGDIITVFSQYGEVVNINLMRHGSSGKSRGFCFLCYQDQRSTILAVDNLNGINLLRRMIRVDHVEQYKLPKYKESADTETKRLWEEGCAPKPLCMTHQRRKISDKEQSMNKKKEKVVSLKEITELNDLMCTIEADRREKKMERKRAKADKKKLNKIIKDEKHALEADWKEQAKLLDKSVEYGEIYEYNKHFNFNFGKKNESVEGPSHNPRPDFEQADWRDIEIWKNTMFQKDIGSTKKHSTSPYFWSSLLIITRSSAGDRICCPSIILFRLHTCFGHFVLLGHSGTAVTKTS
ncbi:hypothetical protein RB195_024763 [Necator americanus]|uniref:RRM domain-containing protein n=1 Tax=Necator americanus TaxID=51031 RepID=A0ABR1ERN1_NECAM